MAGRNWNCACKPSNGKSGGIFIHWRNDIATFQTLFQYDQCVIGKVHMDVGIEWKVDMVYANKDSLIRSLMWNDIGRYHNKNFPLLVCGILIVCYLKRWRKVAKLLDIWQNF